MLGFVLVTITVWGIAVLSWAVLSKRLKSVDADRLKGRLLGKEKTAKKTEGQNVALFQQEDQVKGKIVRKVLTKYNLTKRLQELLEQAGVKWDAARFVHA